MPVHVGDLFVQDAHEGHDDPEEAPEDGGESEGSDDTVCYCQPSPCTGVQCSGYYNNNILHISLCFISIIIRNTDYSQPCLCQVFPGLGQSFALDTPNTNILWLFGKPNVMPWP